MNYDSGREFKRRIQLNFEEQQALIEQLRETTAQTGKRSSVRYDFSQRDLPFTVIHPDGFVSTFLVYGRNLSAEGMSILHGGYVHPGTRCRVELPLITGGGTTIEGNVRHCRLIRDACHEVGVQFLEDIEPREILGIELDDDHLSDLDRGGHIPLLGDILLTSPKGPMRVLMQQRLEAHGLKVRVASTAGAMIDDLRRNPCDVVLHGLSMVEDNGLHALREVRSLGIEKPIVALLADRRPATYQSVVDAGADDVLLQPIEHTLLAAMILSFIGPFTPPASITSATRDRADVRSLLPNYLEFIQRAAERLEHMSEEINTDALREVTLYLKTSAIDFGFAHIAAAAFRVGRLIDRGDIYGDLPEAVAFLAGCCRVASPGDRAQAA